MEEASGFAFEKLFEPGYLGPMKLKNRIVKPAMGTNYGTEEGYVSQRLKDYYAQTAHGGPGLVIVEITCVDSPVGKGIGHQLCIDDDRYIPGLSDLAHRVKQNGAKVAIQLHHAGREAKSKKTGLQPVAPSAIHMPWGEMPRELALAEISSVVDHFAKAAKRAKESGFDGVEIHAAHGYLIAQFLSPLSNKRQDEYGGTLENRARILMEIIRAIKELVGQDYPVWCRINGGEYGVEDGFTLSEAQEIARMCQDHGAHALHVSAFGYGSQTLVNIPTSTGHLIPVAREIQKAVNIPVIAVGRITPELGERALRDKSAEFIAMGRALLADPDLPQKLQSGQFNDVRPCIACLSCLHHLLMEDEPVRCSVNAALGQGEVHQIRTAAQRKRVCIIGGGPAGMEAARVAALRGHNVVLYDKGNKLGGQLLAAFNPPRKDRIKPLIDYLNNQIRKLGITLELGKEATPELVQAHKPDTVVLATGGIPLIPKLPGLNKLKVVTAEEVLANNAEVGDKVVIIGGGMVGCETAEYMVDKGKQVTIVEITRRLASKEIIFIRAELLDSLRTKGVKMLTEVKCEGIADKGVILGNQEGKRVTIEADTIVLAAGAQPNIELFHALEGKVPNMYQVGDCVEPRGILEAMDEGFRIGCEI